MLGQLVAHGTHNGLQCFDTALDHRAVIDVDMAHSAITILIDINDRLQQLIQTATITRHNRHHRHTKHCTQLLIIELIATTLQLVIHIERNHHIGVDVNQLGRKVEVAFEIRRHDSVDDNIGGIIDQMTTHVDLFGRIGRQCVRTRQVGDVETIAFVTERARFGINRNAAIITDVLVATRQSIEQRSLATIWITDQCDIDHSTTSRYHLFDLLLFGHHVAISQLINHILSLGLGDHLDHLSLATTQRDLIAHNLIFDRITQRGIENHLDTFAAHETHLHNPATESTVTQYFENDGRLSGLQVRKSHSIFVVFFYRLQRYTFLRAFRSLATTIFTNRHPML